MQLLARDGSIELGEDMLIWEETGGAFRSHRRMSPDLDAGRRKGLEIAEPSLSLALDTGNCNLADRTAYISAGRLSSSATRW